MRLAITHRITIAQETAAPLALRLRLFPSATQQQSIQHWSVTVAGAELKPLLTDAFGDGHALWFSRRALASLEIRAEGRVETTDAAGVIGKLGPFRPAVYLRTTPATRPTDEIEALAKDADPSDRLALLHALMGAVHAGVAHRPGVSEPGTTAAQALARGAGGTIDLAHLLIAAARARGVPARIAMGYCRAEAEEETEDQLHAWVEAHIDGLGWVAFDPSANVCPADSYVRLVTGFDAADAAPVRMHLAPGAEAALDMGVQIDQETAQAQQ